MPRESFQAQHCAALPPVSPNVYSDGGVCNPTSKHWAVGSFGVFWPLRTHQNQPFSQLEDDFAHTAFSAKGGELWGTLSTPACSSTRAEIVAAILAIAANGPVHLATDSNAFLVKARKLKSQILRNMDPPKWTNHCDGDLWQVYWDLVVHKGPHSLAMSKVKGHAKQHHIDAGLSTPRDQEGNDMADSLATRAHLLREEELGQTVNYFAHRANQYVDLVANIHGFLISMHKAIQMERKKRDQELHPLGTKRLLPVSNKLFYAEGLAPVTIGVVPLQQKTIDFLPDF